MALATILDRLNYKIDELGEADLEWRLYIRDHKKDILDKCITLTLSTDEQYRYEYRPEDVLIDNRLPISLIWILLWINQYPSTEHFYGFKTILIPNLSQIQIYRQDYLTFKSELIRTNQYTELAVI